MELKEFDFTHCRFNPNGKTFTSSISQAIPEFGAYDAKNRKQIFQYIVCLYDKNSPLWQKEPEYFPRKVLAVNLCGLSDDSTSESFTRKAMDIMEGQDDGVNSLVTAYLAYEGDLEYTTLITELAMYYERYRQQAGGKLLDEREYKLMLTVKDNIQLRTRLIFGSGKDEELTAIKNLLYARAEQDRQKLNPEAIAKMLEKDGDLPQDWNRYGAKYKVEPLKFYVDDSQG